MWVEIAALILGAWGAGLSTYLAIRQVRRERPRMHVAVRLSDGWLILPSHPTVVIEAVNTSMGPVHVGSAALCLSDGSEIPADGNAEAVQPPLPNRRDRAERLEVCYPVATVLAELSRKPAGTTVVSACVRDAEGHEFGAKVPEDVRRALAKG